MTTLSPHLHYNRITLYIRRVVIHFDLRWHLLKRSQVARAENRSSIRLCVCFFFFLFRILITLTRCKSLDSNR